MDIFSWSSSGRNELLPVSCSYYISRCKWGIDGVCGLAVSLVFWGIGEFGMWRARIFNITGELGDVSSLCCRRLTRFFLSDAGNRLPRELFFRPVGACSLFGVGPHG